LRLKIEGGAIAPERPQRLRRRHQVLDLVIGTETSRRPLRPREERERRIERRRLLAHLRTERDECQGRVQHIAVRIPRREREAALRILRREEEVDPLGDCLPRGLRRSARTGPQEQHRQQAPSARYLLPRPPKVSTHHGALPWATAYSCD